MVKSTIKKTGLQCSFKQNMRVALVYKLVAYYATRRLLRGLENPRNVLPPTDGGSWGEKGRRCRVCRSLDGMHYYRVTHRSTKKRFPRVSETRRHRSTHRKKKRVHMRDTRPCAQDVIQLVLFIRYHRVISHRSIHVLCHNVNM